jgi:preprotein translocase subunit SecD
MKRNLLWRGILILALVATSVALILPLEEKINLGLDLQGGMQLVLQVHTEDALRAEADSDMGLVIQQAEEKDVRGLQGRRTGDTTFEVTGVTPEARDAVADIASRFLTGYNYSVADGRMTFEMKSDYANNIRQMAVSQAKQTIDNRVNAYGVVEPVIQEASGYRIFAQFPGIDDPERVRRLIKNPRTSRSSRATSATSRTP